MHQFFVPLDQIGETEIVIRGTDVHHIRDVLRLSIGETIGLLDGRGSRYICRVSAFSKEQVTAEITEREMVRQELPSRLCLFQGLPKSDKMEWIIQKAVELGVSEVVPVKTERTVVRLDEKQAKKKTVRYQSIAESAAKQASRGIIPTVHEPVSFREALKAAGACDIFLMPYELAKDMEYTRRVLSRIRPGESVGILIGPEGGFSEKEVQLAEEAGAQTITLGKRILRTETAGLTVLSILMYLLEQ